jgi:hypothetical protein
MSWYAVRHIIKNADHYEERITVWEADSFGTAIARAEAEASEYAWKGTEPLDLYQAFILEAPPSDGAEVFSLIRQSDLAADEYVAAFFATGNELEGESTESSESGQ